MSFIARNHPQQTAARGPLEEVDDRGTDPALFAVLSRRFGDFTIDVAAAPHNAKCVRYFTREDDGLVQSWAGEQVWCNPPYSDCRSWVAKAWVELHAPLIVMLMPANRTEQGWWQDLVEPYRDRPGSSLRVEFLRGRLGFARPEQYLPRGRVGHVPFGSCLLIWEGPRTIGPSLEDLAQQARLL
jgi:phage N-6-adenine-methyltransferase